MSHVVVVRGEDNVHKSLSKSQAERWAFINGSCCYYCCYCYCSRSHLWAALHFHHFFLDLLGPEHGLELIAIDRAQNFG